MSEVHLLCGDGKKWRATVDEDRHCCFAVA
jgi:hypothetical protein